MRAKKIVFAAMDILLVSYHSIMRGLFQFEAFVAESLPRRILSHPSSYIHTQSDSILGKPTTKSLDQMAVSLSEEADPSSRRTYLNSTTFRRFSAHQACITAS